MRMKVMIAAAVAAIYAAAPFAAFAADGAKEKPKKAYPLKTCLISDEELGEMGEPFAFVHKGQEIKLCCKPCQKDFNKDTAKYLKKLEKLSKEQAKKTS